MSTDEVRGKKRVSKTAPRTARQRSKSTKPRKQSAIQEPQSTVVHAPASPGSEMVMIPVKVLPAGTHKKPAAAEASGETPAKASRAARRAAKKASRLRRRARRYSAKAKGVVVLKRTQKKARKATESPERAMPVVREKPQKRPPAKVRPVSARRKHAAPMERTGWLPRPLRNMLVSAFVLLVLLLSGGVVYIFMTGNDAAPATIITAPAATTQPAAIQPRQPAPNTPESASVQMMSPPVRPGGEASLSVKTLPGSACTIAVTYTDQKVPSRAAGLLPATADDFGTVSWNWTVDAAAPDGSWPVTVTCARNKKSAVVQTNLVVTR